MKEPNSDLLALKRDYDSCQQPQWSDPATIRTLDNIVCSIKLGRLSLSEFRIFVEKHLGQGDFAWGCLHYVKNGIKTVTDA